MAFRHQLKRKQSGILDRYIYRPLFHLLSVPVLPILRKRRRTGAVLHLGYAAHQPYHTTRILRKFGIQADFMAIGARSHLWERYDYHLGYSGWKTRWKELGLFWQVVSRYEIIHSHCGVMLSEDGWELPLLKQLGCRIVIHYRGCEARDQQLNMALHPMMNICQQCDYNGTICRKERGRRTLANRYGDLFLVTTPDMLDFVPEGIHLPFFAPDLPLPTELTPGEGRTGNPRSDHDPERPFRIIHITNHPGIEGTEQIRAAIANLQRRGHQIEFTHHHGITHQDVLLAHLGADLSIGKMKMGYYANAQIESMVCGVPAVTYVRSEFITPEMEESGLILTDLAGLEQTIEFYLTHPDELAKKRDKARSSILRLHDNKKLATKLIGFYRQLLDKSESSRI
jgi:hypothetical protein